MAIVIRYFGVTGAGALDGTTFADRAPLFSAGAWSTIITAFDFTSNSLECRIKPGDYAITVALATFSSTAPSTANPCILHAVNDSGVLWVPPTPGWKSAQPVWDATGMPNFASTTNISTVNHIGVVLRGIKFTASGVTSAPVVSSCNIVDWVYIVCSSANTSAVGLAGGTKITNVCIEMTGSSYSAAWTANSSVSNHNTRLVGTMAASSGTRRGVSSASNALLTFSLLTSLNHVGGHIFLTGTGTSVRLNLNHGTLVNASASSADGVSSAGTATVPGGIHGSVIVNSGGYGINVAGTGRIAVVNSRLRNNASGNFSGMGNWPDYWDTNVAAGTDAAEFVDIATGDVRIKYGSSLWGKGYGAGDQPAISGFSLGRLVS